LEYRVKGLGYMAHGLGYIVKSQGLMIKGLEKRVYSLGFMV